MIFFKPCDCLYEGHWRLTWLLTLGPVELVEVHASWPGKKKYLNKTFPRILEIT
jgi:hypothetical protein